MVRFFIVLVEWYGGGFRFNGVDADELGHSFSVGCKRMVGGTLT